MIAGVAMSKGYEVNMLTGHPDAWNKEIVVTDENGSQFSGCFNSISNAASEIIPDSDLVLLCLPGTAMKNWLEKIKPYLKRDTAVGSVFCATGFFPIALDILGSSQKLFGLQRVPFISRLDEYGKSASLLGYRNEIRLALWNINESDDELKFLEEIFCAPVKILSSPLAVTFTNSNPILHPSRLYALFKDYSESKGYPKNPLFYGEWDEESSQMLIDCDREFQNLISQLNINNGEIPDLLTYYESTDCKSLTNKITSIESWHNLLSPMVLNEDGTYHPDFSSRYFTEDIPQGLFVFKAFSHALGLPTPTFDKILHWCQNLLETDFIDRDNHPVWNEKTRSLPLLNRNGMIPMLETINSATPITMLLRSIL